MDIQEIIKRCLAGDRKAQYQLYRDHVQILYHTVIRMTGNKSDADDLVQNSFIKIFKSLKNFSGQGSFQGWLKRIAINETLDMIRKKQKMKIVPMEHIPEDGSTEDALELVSVNSETIHQAIKNLPHGCRLVFSLYLLEGYSHKEVAGMLNISESTSKTQYKRAKSILKSSLTTVQL